MPDPARLDALRAQIDAEDHGHLIADAVLDDEVVDNPMVGITVRLPRTLLQGARSMADRRGTKVTALIRHWVEQGVQQNERRENSSEDADSDVTIARAVVRLSIDTGSTDIDGIVHRLVPDTVVGPPR